MTEGFKRFKNEDDIANAFREGWQAACNLHIRKHGEIFPVAWLKSDAFSRTTDEDQRTDRWILTADQKVEEPL